MTESEDFNFKNEAGEDQAIKSKDLVASIANQQGTSTIIYVEQDENEAFAIPKVKITKGAATHTAQPPDTSDIETHIIVSIASGTTKAAPFYEEAVKPVLETLYPKGHVNFILHHTKSPDTIKELTSGIFFPTANAGISLRIILLSGDGGIIDLINGLLATPHSTQYKIPELVPIPLGTANALYHSTNAGRDNTWGLRNLSSTLTKPLPIFTTTFSPGARLLINEATSEIELPKDPQTQRQRIHGAVVCSWAMHASLVADSDTTEYRKHGIQRFQMAAKENLYPSDGSPPHVYRATVSTLAAPNGTWTPLNDDHDQEHMYVLATMVSNLEKPFCISPHSKSLNGSMHLVQFGPTTGDEAMRIMGLAYQGGKHVEDPSVTYKAVEGVRIAFKGREKEGRWRRICVDGTIVRVEEDGWVEVTKVAARVVDVVV
ncbi:hypothetical protein DM02DRAFT_615301 [Periconia macrospinosa]|uniref:DAGKc domain-containing protein n=1 Tax=Periconia macrospinosa TaxID=97972 RepID=A0A2V1DMQ4_9PLEO|nr:hypothetical protein DM02DRAFT_615301 [Periconia macrospinosa]